MAATKLLEPLIDALEGIRDRIGHHGALLKENETRTRRSAIDPLLDVLGWDTEDPTAVVHEYKVSTGWADYALMTEEGRPILALEAKKLGERLEPNRTQMVTYANIAGIPYCGLTDGDHWEIYDVFKQKPLEDKCILKASIVNDPIAGTALKFMLLWKPNMLTTDPIQAPSPLGDKTEDPPPPAPPEEGWTKLSDFKFSNQGRTPTRIRFPDRTERELATARQMVTETAEWLYKNKHLVPGLAPIASGKKRNLVEVDSGTNDEDQNHYKKILDSNLRVLVHLGRGDCQRASIKLAKECGQDPEQFLLN